MKNILLHQIFAIRLDQERTVICAPLKHIAFVGNASLVDHIHELCTQGDKDPVQYRDELIKRLHSLGFYSAPV